MHKKPSDFNESSPLLEAQAAFFESQKGRLEAIARAQGEFFKQFESLNREAVESWKQSAEEAREMASQASSNPQDAMRLYFDWMSNQIERWADQSRRFSAQWMTIVQQGVTQAQDVQAQAEKKLTAAAQPPVSRTTVTRKVEPIKPHSAAN